MSDIRISNVRAILLGAVISAPLSQTAVADASTNPFASVAAPGGAGMLAQGKCGEGKCGGGKMQQGGKCGMQRMDADGDGKITREEFMQGHEDMFSRIDANGDGVIDSTERDAHRQMMMRRKGKCGQAGTE